MGLCPRHHCTLRITFSKNTYCIKLYFPLIVLIVFRQFLLPQPQKSFLLLWFVFKSYPASQTERFSAPAEGGTTTASAPYYSHEWRRLDSKQRLNGFPLIRCMCVGRRSSLAHNPEQLPGTGRLSGGGGAQTETVCPSPLMILQTVRAQDVHDGSKPTTGK